MLCYFDINPKKIARSPSKTRILEQIIDYQVTMLSVIEQKCSHWHRAFKHSITAEKTEVELDLDFC